MMPCIPDILKQNKMIQNKVKTVNAWEEQACYQMGNDSKFCHNFKQKGERKKKKRKISKLV